MRRSRSILAALVAAATLAIVPGQHGRAQGVLGESGLVGELEGAKVQPMRHGRRSSARRRCWPNWSRRASCRRSSSAFPHEPLVIQPLNEIGKYGGTWRRAFTGPGDGENGNRINASDKLLFWDSTGSKIVPCVAKDLEHERRRQDLHAVTCARA